MFSFIIFGVMIAFAVGYIGSLGVRVGLPAHRTDVSMQVADVNGLVVGSNVLLRGVPVGKVSKIKTSVDRATVDFYIGDQFHVPVDSEVRLENLSALGESYIELLPRSQRGPMFRDGDRIATESVTQPASISELATSFARVLKQLDSGSLERITQEADTALPPTNAVLPNLARTSRLLRSTAADLHGSGRELLNNVQVLLGNAGWLGPVIADLTPMVDTLNPHIRSLFSTFPAAVDLGAPEIYYKLDAFLARIQKLLDDNGGDLRVLGETFQPHIKGIAGALLNFDTGQMLTNVLDGLPKDGTITLHVNLQR
ncbi:MAG TPA: MlaD family protein [Mycobacterium sp.]|nr:MlaD family protein [Mycobacterium sp.]